MLSQEWTVARSETNRTATHSPMSAPTPKRRRKHSLFEETERHEDEEDVISVYPGVSSTTREMGTARWATTSCQRCGSDRAVADALCHNPLMSVEATAYRCQMALQRRCLALQKDVINTFYR